MVAVGIARSKLNRVLLRWARIRLVRARVLSSVLIRSIGERVVGDNRW